MQAFHIETLVKGLLEEANGGKFKMNTSENDVSFNFQNMRGKMVTFSIPKKKILQASDIVMLVERLLEAAKGGRFEMIASENGVSFKFRNVSEQMVIFPIPNILLDANEYIKVLEEQKQYEDAILPLKQFPATVSYAMQLWTESKVPQKNFKSNFDAFYEHNIDEVRKRTKTTPFHPLNVSRVENWANTMKRGIEKLLRGDISRQSMMTFVENFQKSIKHVSMADFRNKVDAIAKEFVLYMEKKPHHDCVVLVLDTYSDKSSLWVTLLAYERIQKFITHVLSVNETRKFNQRGKFETPLIIMFDDASYSGYQYGDHIGNMCWDTKQRITFWCAIPYISTNARSFIDKTASQNAVCIFPQSCEYFEPVVAENALPIDSGRDLELLTKYFAVSDMKAYVPSRHAIYFDHKLADRTSCYTQIMAFSIALSPTHLMRPFVILPYMIEGCDKQRAKITRKNYTAEEILRLVYDDNDDESKGFRCPNPVYKSFQYEEKSTRNLFKMMETQMCFSCVDAPASRRVADQPHLFFCDNDECMRKFFFK